MTSVFTPHAWISRYYARIFIQLFYHGKMWLRRARRWANVNSVDSAQTARHGVSAACRTAARATRRALPEPPAPCRLAAPSLPPPDSSCFSLGTRRPINRQPAPAGRCRRPLRRSSLHPPTTPPSCRRMTTVAERGRPPVTPLNWFAGQPEPASGLRGCERPPATSPGCWLLTNRLQPSGVAHRPLISQPFGPVRKRRISPLRTSARSRSSPRR